jgi:multidrug transporter EmrE-like cation transporter
MEQVGNFISKGVELWWSLWPRNFYFLVAMSALSEAASVVLFAISKSRGSLSLLAYIMGILVVAFYGEALRYSKLGQSYPVWLVLVAVFISASSFFILKEKIGPMWFLGFTVTLIGLIIIQYSLPPES